MHIYGSRKLVYENVNFSKCTYMEARFCISANMEAHIYERWISYMHIYKSVHIQKLASIYAHEGGFRKCAYMKVDFHICACIYRSASIYAHLQKASTFIFVHLWILE
jgi:hypothetical protein